MRIQARMMLVTIISMMAATGQSASNNAASIDYVTNYVQSQLATIQSVTTYTVGQHALGGTVFYVDSTGTHGLVATNSQTGSNQTWNGDLSTNITVNATGNGIEAGAINTSLMVGVQSSSAVSQSTTLTAMAAQVCVNYATQDNVGTPCDSPGTTGEPCYANWYLPSKYELYQLYLQRDVLGSRDDAFMWSSTEANESSAWRLNFSNGGEGATDKSDQCGVWCIHSF